MEEILTIPEFAAELGVNRSTVYYHVTHGNIYGRKVSTKLWLIPRSELERFKAAGSRIVDPSPVEVSPAPPTVPSPPKPRPPIPPVSRPFIPVPKPQK